MTLSRYEIFHTIVQCGSLTKAAETLNLTQPGISHAITNLEKELGFTLLTRNRSGIQLTNNGERILPYIHDIIMTNEKIKQEAAAINGLETGIVRIGSFSSISIKWLPHLIKHFQSAHPGITLKLCEGDYTTLEKWLANGNIDCSFFVSPAPKPFQFLPLHKDKMVCIASHNYPLPNNEKLSFHEIEKEPLIMPSESWDNDIGLLFAENQKNLTIKFRVSDDQAIFAMVENNLGISIRPELTLANLPANIRIIGLETDCFRLIGMASKTNRSPATEKFIDMTYTWLNEEGFINV
ncbi:DNA-binding transcriptional regulator, LysR family [Terribacillus aidingensis]|uniref:DNA-binding transcriptional regulator, LysR family n=1 Tax=Terribacillus aidingensis TaxID=586416 RepID=A0A285P774_9BACI|nr:LysR family transcriptional regulator [Terribacillus aidingensis]SNZ17572.1 DNA-binding transcriptional regulator, LysR family [Terribacillus aidingensis]